MSLVPPLLRATVALLVVAATVAAHAEHRAVPGPRPYGSLFRMLAGDAREREHGVAVIGVAHATAAESNRNIDETLLPQGRGRNLQPQSGVVQDEGLNLNQLALIVCKGAGCPFGRVFETERNVIGRVTPLPGARGERLVVDFNVSAMYGEDVFFWKTKGFDDWTWDVEDRHKFGILQWFVDLYLPVWEGVSLMLGSFQSPLAHEVGYAFVPPNWFSGRTHAFAAGPAKHVGALAQAKLPLPIEYGIASVSFGVVTDWNAVDFGSGTNQPTFLFGASWRSADLRTWLDFESSYGNGEDDFGDTTLVDGVPRPLGGGTQYLALSSEDAYLDRFVAYFSVLHAATALTSVVMESVFGYQQGGDLAPLPFAITRDSVFYGVNGALRHRLADALHWALRLEWFRDEQAANVLWSSVGAGGGDVYAVSTNLAWEPVPHLLVRPELRVDVYDGTGHLFATGANGLARRDSQLLAVLNFEFRF